MGIPIQNIYYLLCYAWDKLDEQEKIQANLSDYSQIVDLFARVLVSGCNQLFKRGLDRGYIDMTEEYSGVKGKMNFTETINANLIRRGKAVCDFDDFQSNVLQNQIIKATLFRISKVDSLDTHLQSRVHIAYRTFSGVNDIQLQKALFAKVKIHRNNSFYDFLLRLCKIIFESTSLSEDKDAYVFKDFSRDKLAQLFEAFVRNFYKREQIEYKVSRPKIRWMATALGESDIKLLPDMNTDMILESASRKIILDTKYYEKTTSEYFEVEKFHPNNLYQIYSYLRNIEEDDSSAINLNAEGILLYPTVKSEYDHQFLIGGHRLRVATVDLAQSWQGIEKRLMYIIS